MSMSATRQISTYNAGNVSARRNRAAASQQQELIKLRPEKWLRRGDSAQTSKLNDARPLGSDHRVQEYLTTRVLRSKVKTKNIK
jgi:hypothetical protein